MWGDNAGFGVFVVRRFVGLDCGFRFGILVPFQRRLVV